MLNIFCRISNKTITEIADKVNPKITANAVLIAHSAGGLVARSMQKKNAKVKAIVTLGTPNQGAGIVKVLNNRTYRNVINELGNRGERAVQKSLKAANRCVPPITWVISPLTNTARKVLSVAMALTKSIANRFADRYVDAYYSGDKTVQDMAPGSVYMKSISGNVNIPIINICGEEDYWQVVRLGGSLARRYDVTSFANSDDKTYDEEYFHVMRKIQGKIDDVCRVHSDVYRALRWVAFGLPWVWGTREYVLSAKHEWESVKRYVNHDMHNSYSQMIGAIHYDKRTYYKGWWPFRKKRTSIIPVYEGHDGLIANRDSKIPINKGNVKNVVVKGVNHMEMSGHPAIKKELEKIINTRGIEYDKSFNPNNY